MRLDIDPGVVRAAQAGEPGDIESLLRLIWPHAYRIALSVVQDRELAQDAAQETCAIIYRELGGLRSIDAFRVWMYRIVMREALRLAKRDALPFTLAEPRVEADIHARLDVLRALAALPPELRAAVVLRYYADLNSSEIGLALSIPSATVRFRLARAKQRLSRLLDVDHGQLAPLPEGCA